MIQMTAAGGAEGIYNNHNTIIEIIIIIFIFAIPKICDIFPIGKNRKSL